MKFFKKNCIVYFFCVILGLLSFLIIFFGTNIGKYCVLNGATYFFRSLKFDTVSGSWDNLIITDLSYYNDNGCVKINKVNISIDFKKMWKKELNVRYLLLDKVLIKIHDNKLIKENIFAVKQKIKKNRTYLSFPTMIFKKIKLCDVYITTNDNVIAINTCDTGLVFHDCQLTVLPTYIQEITLNKSSFFLKNFTDKSLFFNVKIVKNIFEKVLGSNFLMNLFNCKFPLDFIMNDVQLENLNFIFFKKKVFH